jgi:DDE domain
MELEARTGQWHRGGPVQAVDSTGATIDFLLSESRDITSARRFFQKALAAPRCRIVPYLNNIVERSPLD